MLQRNIAVLLLVEIFKSIGLFYTIIESGMLQNTLLCSEGLSKMGKDIAQSEKYPKSRM
jgi:hypothetical protein